MSTPFMGMTVPTVGVTTGTLYGQNIDDCLNTIDSHDHSSGKGTPVPTAGIVENADHEMNNFRLTEAKAIVFQSQTGSLISGADIRSLWWSGSDFCVTDDSGTKTVLFHNGKFNVPALSGAIGGDYSGSTALFAYVNSLTKFYGAQATAGASINYAGLDIGDLKILPKGNLGQTTGVTLVCPPNMGSNKSFTLPAAFPAASTQVMTLGTTGIISSSFDPSCNSVTTTEADIRHGQRHRLVAPNMFTSYEQVHGGTSTGSQLNMPGVNGFTSSEWATNGTSGDIAHFEASLGVDVGQTVVSAIASVTDTGAKTTLRVFRSTTGGASTKVAHVESGASSALQHLTASLATTVADGQIWTMVVSTSGSSQKVHGGRVITTRP